MATTLKKTVGEKRLYPRKRYKTRVIFEDEFGDGLFYLYSEDISMGGILLESNVPARMGSLLFLSFELPNFKRRIAATCEVVRKSSDPDGKSGAMGVRFVGLDDHAIDRLQNFLAQ